MSHLTSDPSPRSGQHRVSSSRHQRWQQDLGQATAEYALVLLGAAAIALILLGWATGGGGGRISGLLDHVVSAVTGHAK
jgi:hypothetical protein